MTAQRIFSVCMSVTWVYLFIFHLQPSLTFTFWAHELLEGCYKEAQSSCLTQQWAETHEREESDSATERFLDLDDEPGGSSLH